MLRHTFIACLVEYTADKISASHCSVQKDNIDTVPSSESKALLLTTL